MKCHVCESCGQPIESDKSGTQLCVPVMVGTASGDSEHCWCLCSDCQKEFEARSAKVLRRK